MIFENLKKLIAKELGVKEENINLDSHLVNDLGADSLDAVELIMTIEDEFEITINENDATNLTTVKAIVEYIENNQ
ncbi:MAG: acyl carrier protein [Candidatus Izemoplasmatales bacterium]|uniref:Acyl carrier protein n=2 Tax=Hujiaoplasma nucleasis TaxID=2725268 RepID=A0A7L6N6Z4_9MOLU|nr:acyl carrier protein [Hujiaoplasma nucleasis]